MSSTSRYDNPDDFTDRYDDYLDSADTVSVLGREYDLSYVLKRLDPVGYRCGLHDYIDALIKEDPEED